jgi:excalibur calcium-binding domain-containing protein
MRSPRLVLAGLASGALLTALLAVPAYAAPVTGPNTTACINATTKLHNDQIAQAAAQTTYNAAHRTEVNAQNAYNAALADTDPTNDAADLAALNAATARANSAQTALTNAESVVGADQTRVNNLCAVVVTPDPTPPVGLPRPGWNCAQLAARGLHDIPAGNFGYSRANDPDNDGIACETAPSQTVEYRIIDGKKCHQVNGQWVPVDPTPAPVTVVNGCPCPPAPVVVESAPQPVTVTLPPSQVFQTQVAPSVPVTSAGDGSLAGQS